MNRKLIIANWKMNGSISLLNDFFDILSAENLIIAIPYPLIAFAKLNNANAKIASQDCSIFKGNGAYTGEVSADMLREFGAEYIIVGHSERRMFLKETSEIINKKIKNSLSAGLKIIYCVNEDFKNQIKTELEGGEERSNIMVAYEPMSAIGTGVTPSVEEIALTVVSIKNLAKCEVLYGGSVTSKNISDFMGIEGINGVLVGGASLKIYEVRSMLSSCLS
jgi:triosephosphate isomerase